MKRIAVLILVMLLALGCTATPISGVVQWGAGGGTDTLMRPLCALAEQQLDRTITMRNMTGGTGTVATQYVYDKAADGDTLLLGAENPALYDALSLSDLTYADFDCILLVGCESVGIVVQGDSPYATIDALLAAAKAQPDTIRLATTGKGGLPWTVASFLEQVTGVRFLQVPYDSDATARTAVQNCECDVTVCKVQAAIDAHQDGTLRFLCMFTDAPVDGLSDVPPITEYDATFAKFLPWGPFYGVFVKKGVDSSKRETLTNGFLAAFLDDSYQALLKELHIEPLGLSGKAAAEYIQNWRESSLSALQGD